LSPFLIFPSRHIEVWKVVVLVAAATHHPRWRRYWRRFECGHHKFNKCYSVDVDEQKSFIPTLELKLLSTNLIWLASGVVDKNPPQSCILVQRMARRLYIQIHIYKHIYTYTYIQIPDYKKIRSPEDVLWVWWTKPLPHVIYHSCSGKRHTQSTNQPTKPQPPTQPNTHRRLPEVIRT
jgi:hypothetical protein